jgi:signal transduction histidine kinase/CheY-like chemotaxis protein
MHSQNQNAYSGDYLGPDISELARRRSQQGDALNSAGHSAMTRALARGLLPACLAAPALLWWALYFGQGQGWYDLEGCFLLFVFSVTTIFGLIVCLNLKRLARLDAERQRAEEQTKLARDAAEAANRFKSAFFANISHEIRTPLTAINGFAELILNPNRTSAERLDDARIIRRNGEHLLTLINDILDLSKIEAGKMTVERISCCPASLVGEVCAMLRQRATEKGLKLDVAFEGPIPTAIKTDPTRVRQVLINLVSNAIKFTRSGGVTVSAAVTPAYHDAHPLFQVQIKDTGIGIPAERLDTLFQPFVQGDATITRQYGGSGLGLAISRHFARALGGDVTVVSEAGCGSTFTFTIETDSLLGVQVNNNPQQALELPDTSTGPQVRFDGSILVAEDGIDNQALIATRLRQTGLSVEIAPNGKLACDKALAALKAQQPFDLVLMDVQMPVMDGYSATLHLRSNGYRGPIIALTANAMERDRDKCISAGCNDFVTKPIQLNALFKAIGRYVKAGHVPESTAAEQIAASPSRESQVAEFYQSLPVNLAEMEQAITRQDRTRLAEVVQLLLGKSAALGLKDVASEAARLFQAIQSDASFESLIDSLAEFSGSAQPPSDRQAA